MGIGRSLPGRAAAPHVLLDMLALMLAAFDFTAPTPIIIAIVIIVVGLLVIRFVLKSAFTLLKIGILVAIGVAVYLGIAWLVERFG